jgi:calcium-dependent protein kinase
LDEEKIESIISNLDSANNKKINYSEFLAATVDVTKILTQPRLDSLFNTFDMDQTGQLTEKNIKDAFTKFGRDVTDEEMKNIMDQHCDGGVLH